MKDGLTVTKATLCTVTMLAVAVSWIKDPRVKG